jgi:hypothetical protein
MKLGRPLGKEKPPEPIQRPSKYLLPPLDNLRNFLLNTTTEVLSFFQELREALWIHRRQTYTLARCENWLNKKLINRIVSLVRLARPQKDNVECRSLL